jgi:hypothetical protein
MSIVQYDPDNWLVSMTRALASYVEITLNDLDVRVEMSFPDVRLWEKTSPLDKVLIHFEQDDLNDPPMGFGVPGLDVFDDVTDPLNPTYIKQEAAWHDVNYDVGVWVSVEQGGPTKRMQTVQALKNMFATAVGRLAFNEAVGGLTVVSFNGGRNNLDRINDVPVWRVMEMSLVLRAISRHIPVTTQVAPLDFVQDEDLTIANPGGTQVPIETP